MRFLTDNYVRRCYIKFGAIFGDAVSYIGMGECVGFEKFLAKWEKWEAEYARRGFRTLSLRDFVAYGGYGEPLNDVDAKRVKGEEPVFHAKIYREKYLGKIAPAVDIAELTRPCEPNETLESRVQVGTYFIPDTKKTK